ncbi:uncharacterized protein TNCV_1987331 [Trichonephila clavipes]|nr:uncharacterized protein TNCV_1987331 [Trichonephila clavipes]
MYGHKCWKKSSKIGRPDWTTSEPAVTVLCQESYLKSVLVERFWSRTRGRRCRVVGSKQNSTEDPPCRIADASKICLSLMSFHWCGVVVRTVQFSSARHHFKRRRRCVGVKGSTRNGCRDPKCPSARRLSMVRGDTGAPSEGATCAWMAADEAVGCKRAFRTMGRSFQRLNFGSWNPNRGSKSYWCAIDLERRSRRDSISSYCRDSDSSYCRDSDSSYCRDSDSSRIAEIVTLRIGEIVTLRIGEIVSLRIAEIVTLNIAEIVTLNSRDSDS